MGHDNASSQEDLAGGAADATPRPQQSMVDSSTTTAPLHLLLDAGYGIPRESRPRQEKILAMAKQISNFLEWQRAQHHGQQKSTLDSTPPHIAPVTVIGCHDEDMKALLLDRLERLLSCQKDTTTETSTDKKEEDPPEESPEETPILPRHFSFARDEEHTRELLQDAVYLSPDAPSSLHPGQPPPAKVIVGLLIDRRVQVNRSLSRSEQLQLEARRWPMEVLEEALQSVVSVGDDGDNQQQQYQPYYHTHEPLNVDTILEALQQWSWNALLARSRGSDGEEALEDDRAFRHASLQAFYHHAQRHPARPKHR